MTYHAASRRLPVRIVRARAQTLSLAVRDGAGAAASVTSGTITIRDPDGTAVVSAQPIVPASGVATYALLAAAVPSSYDFSTDWTIEWNLTLSTGDLVDLVEDAFLVRRIPVPPVDQDALVRRHPADLETQYPTPAARQVFVDDAWEILQGWMLRDGYYPEAALGSWQFAETLIAIALGLAYHNAATYTSGRGKYAEMADRYHFGKDPAPISLVEYGRLRWATDTDQDGIADADTARVFDLYGVKGTARGLG